MSNQNGNADHRFKKMQLADTVTFAIENIPSVDKHTLDKFLQLVHTTGTFGDMTATQIMNKMVLTLKYVPNACLFTMKVLAELLELEPAQLPRHLSLTTAADGDDLAQRSTKPTPQLKAQTTNHSR